ncbi:MAG TPA: SpoIIE family protein phosphatase [Terriglobia bacterium]|nr:SpoIIE family protein phosphatase [Terriglobia bacterium]
MPTDASSSTILVVDDSPVNIQVLVRTLDGTGHRILVATNGKSALEIVHRTHPDLILLDVMMPDIDGFNVCRRIKADPATQDIAVIFLSALGEVQDKVAGLQLGAVDYITKPIQAEEVLARVSNHLALRHFQKEVRKSRDELDQELASAAEMQRMILPQLLPKGKGLSFAANYETSRHVGGDYYDVVSVSEDETGVLIADISGHGAPSAIVMAMVRAIFHAFPGRASEPAEVLQFINRQFRFMWGSAMLATVLYAVVDRRSLRMRASCCGHLPPVLLRNGDVQLLELDATRPLLLMDLENIPCDELILQRGDRLLLYTDGVTECQDPDDNMYEIERLVETLRSVNGKGPQEILRSVAIDLDKFARGRELLDDRTLLLMSLDP